MWASAIPFLSPFLVQVAARLKNQKINKAFDISEGQTETTESGKVSLLDVEALLSRTLRQAQQNTPYLLIKVSINVATEVVRLTSSNGLRAEQRLINTYRNKVKEHFLEGHVFNLDCCSFIILVEGDIDMHLDSITRFKRKYGHLTYQEDSMRFFPKLLIGTTALSENIGDSLSRLEYAAQKATMLTPLNSWHIDVNDEGYQHHRNSRMRLRHVRHVLHQKEIGLFVQPIVMLTGQQSLPKYEVLMRHYASAEKILSPIDVLAPANFNRVSQDVDIYVITLLCENFARLFGENGEQVGALSINISGNSFAIPCFADVIDEIVCRYNVPKDKLILEVTEDITSSKMADARATMASFRSKGFKLALDDIGTGSSNFQNLRNLPIDYFKIDRAYCEAMLDDKSTFQFVKMIIDVAKLKGKSVIAEGIPNEETKDMLIALGADYSQSFITGKPRELIIAPKYQSKMAVSSVSAA